MAMKAQVLVLCVFFAVAQAGDHCPKCGDLVCPHGFTAQETPNHCCPYCVNPSVSTEVVKDPAYYAKEADPVYKKYAGALVQAPANDHCPKCGNLVCPHGFTATPSPNHCCPYCVNPSVSTEVVKDPAYYAENADPVYKKYAGALVQGDHCPKCGDLVCPHGFTAQTTKNHCCPYCVNPSVSTEVVKDPAYYAANADPVYKKYAGAFVQKSNVTDMGKGLSLDVTKAGDGHTFPKAGDELAMHYTGTLAANGKKFDSSRDRGQPFKFTIGVGQVIPGWDNGVIHMSLGERGVLHVPANMGYGAQGAGDDIPPNADLNFDVELLAINGRWQ